VVSAKTNTRTKARGSEPPHPDALGEAIDQDEPYCALTEEVATYLGVASARWAASSVANSAWGCRRDLRARHRVGHWSPVKPAEVGPRSAGGDSQPGP
jgi:hypothetical protein